MVPASFAQLTKLVGFILVNNNAGPPTGFELCYENSPPWGTFSNLNPGSTSDLSRILPCGNCRDNFSGICPTSSVVALPSSVACGRICSEKQCCQTTVSLCEKLYLRGWLTAYCCVNAGKVGSVAVPTSCTASLVAPSLLLNGMFLIGTIPSILGALNGLTGKLNLYSNSLSGSIPSSLAMLTALQELAVDDNKLVGSLPMLSVLLKLHVSNNMLTGEIPSSIAALSITSLYVAHIFF